MFDYDSIKQLGKLSGRPVKDLLALSQTNDPFYAGVGSRGRAAEWFGAVWRQFGFSKPHLRRIHYVLISQPEGTVVMPNGRSYQNTMNDWSFLCWAGLAARYLDLVPFDGLTDQRNDEPMIFCPTLYSEPTEDRGASCAVVSDDIDVDVPDMPGLPGYAISGLDDADAIQDFIVEVWIEKSTQNDWLVPLCRRRGVNLVVGIGEQSETRSRELALRASEYGAPVRILYLSDFDPGGRSMPKAVARKVEFTIERFGLDVDMQLIPVALTPDQVREYKLPRTPIKETERRKDRFEQTFGVGATELDALEALYPGRMGELLEAEIDNFLDADLLARVRRCWSETRLPLGQLEAEIRDRYSDQVEELERRFDEIVEQLKEWETEASDVWTAISDELDEHCPDLSDVEVPRSEDPGETDRFVLFDSTRDYLTQMDYYNAWREGEE